MIALEIGLGKTIDRRSNLDQLFPFLKSHFEVYELRLPFFVKSLYDAGRPKFGSISQNQGIFQMPISSRLQGVVQPHPIALEDEGYKKMKG